MIQATLACVGKHKQGRPLVAAEMCVIIGKNAEQFHETLHRLAGYEQSFGVQIGPARVIALANYE